MRNRPSPRIFVFWLRGSYFGLRLFLPASPSYRLASSSRFLPRDWCFFFVLWFSGDRAGDLGRALACHATQATLRYGDAITRLREDICFVNLCVDLCVHCASTVRRLCVGLCVNWSVDLCRLAAFREDRRARTRKAGKRHLDPPEIPSVSGKALLRAFWEIEDLEIMRAAELGNFGRGKSRRSACFSPASAKVWRKVGELRLRFEPFVGVSGCEYYTLETEKLI